MRILLTFDIRLLQLLFEQHCAKSCYAHEVVTTGCSGTGAPTLALVELVGQSNSYIGRLAGKMHERSSCRVNFVGYLAGWRLWCFKKDFKQALVPTPSSQATTLILGQEDTMAMDVIESDDETDDENVS